MATPSARAAGAALPLCLLLAQLLLTATVLAPPWEAAASSGTAAHAPAVQSVRITQMRVEYGSRPIGLDVAQPRFAWQLALEPDDAVRGVSQQAYRIIVSTAASCEVGDAWDSGMVAGNASAHIVYGGLPLSADTTYYWRVTVWWDADVPHGSGAFRVMQQATTSVVESFDTGLPEPEDWDGARWLGGFGNQFRGDFVLPTVPARARLFVTAVGCYSLWINGIPVEDGRRRLDPGFSTVFQARVLYSGFNVTQLLRAGANTIGLWLGTCQYGYIGSFCVLGAAACNALLLKLSIVDAAGRRWAFVSDERTGAWRVMQGPVVAESLYHGEQYDARLELPDWNRPEGGRSQAWSRAQPRRPSVGRLSALLMPPIAEQEVVRPVRCYPTMPGHVVCDMGDNIAGYTRILRVRGAAGDTIVLSHAEITYPDGSIQNVYACGPGLSQPDGGNCANQTDRFILRGAPEGESYTPSFTYHGFRYVDVFGFPGNVTPDDIEGVVVTTRVERSGSMQLNSTVLEQIQRAIVRTQRDNLHSIPTDCPTREKRGWLGDGQWTSLEAMYNLDMAAFYTNWVRTMRDSAQIGCELAAVGTGNATSVIDAAPDAALPVTETVRPATYVCCDGSGRFGCDHYVWRDTAGSLPGARRGSTQPRPLTARFATASHAARITDVVPYTKPTCMS